MIKRLSAIILSMTLVVGMLPAFVLAEGSQEEPEETVITKTTKESVEETTGHTEKDTEKETTKPSETEASAVTGPEESDKEGETEPSETTPAETEPSVSEREEETVPSETEPNETVPSEEPAASEEETGPSETEQSSPSEAPQTASRKASDATIASGKCGNNIDWTLNDSGTLNLTGSGIMYSYTDTELPPWNSSKDKIKALVIGSGISNVGSYSFYGCKNLKSVSLPNTISQITTYAFAYCTSLESITVPDSVTHIGVFAFSHCDSLKNVKLGKSVATISGSFSSCTSLKTIYLPDSVINMNGAFSYCTSLVSINIPAKIEIIGRNTFLGCTSLKTIAFPKTLEVVLQDAFKDCKNLTDVHFGGTENEWNDVSIDSGNDALRSANIHFTGSGTMYSITVKTVTGGYITLPKYAASQGETITLTAYPDSGYYLSSIIVNGTQIYGTTFTMPGEDVTVEPRFFNKLQTQVGDSLIDGSIFHYQVTNNAVNGTGTVKCLGLIYADPATVGDPYVTFGNISIPSTVSWAGITYKVTSIAPNAFRGLVFVKNLTIGSNVAVIGDNAFFGCTGLVKVSGGAGLKTIGKNAFARCTKLSSFSITSKVLYKINYYAFSKDSKLKTLYLKYTTKLTKKGVKKALKGSKVKTVKVKKSKVKKYKKYFTKKNCGRKVKVKK